MEHISPFELKNKLIELASQQNHRIQCAATTMLNAGRGNPNWICTLPREAFFTLGRFGMEECKRVMDLSDDIAGIPEKEGCGERFREFIKNNPDAPGIQFLSDAFDYRIARKADPDGLAHEWAEGVIGDQYPVPDRILKYTEEFVQDYLHQEMAANHEPLNAQFDLFATEGGTAGMCYLFDSLQQNYLLNKGDRIALFVPVFTPYIEIPELDRYDFEVTFIRADILDEEGYHTWQYRDEDVDKLKDKSIKAAFIVNPSNPPSYAMNEETLKRIGDIVRNDNPDLMIITDDVYGTFIPEFKSLLVELPQNTLCVYSFSKYFGATGWRLAVIALDKENIYDRMIAELPQEKKNDLNKRYGTLTLEPEKMKFIDRMVADSRQVALNHTAGLSLPQQIQMSLFAAYALLDKEGKYKAHMHDLIQERLHALWDNTGFKLIEDPLRAGYYSEIDMLVWAEKFHGKEFVEYLKANYEPVDVVFRLAQQTSLVLLNGGGFDGPEWSIRASLANLNKDDYKEIGHGIACILNEYADFWKKSKEGKN